MSYTTEAEVRRLSKLTDETDVSEEDIRAYMDKAQARIDARLGKVYKVPLADPVPAIIASIAGDFAAGFAIEKHYSNRPDKTEPYLAEILIKRAEADLAEVIADGLLDKLPGIVKITPPQKLNRPAILSTTNRRSEMDEALGRWLR